MVGRQQETGVSAQLVETDFVVPWIGGGWTDVGSPRLVRILSVRLT